MSSSSPSPIDLDAVEASFEIGSHEAGPEPAYDRLSVDISGELLSHPAVTGRMRRDMPTEVVLDFIYRWCKPVAQSSRLYGGSMPYRLFELAVALRLPQVLESRRVVKDPRHLQALRWLDELASLPRDIVVGEMATGRSNLAFLSRKMGLIPRPIGAGMLSPEVR